MYNTTSNATPALTSRELRFIQSYIETNNQSKSAIKAGYSANGAHVTGYRLLRKPHIQAVISSELEKREKHVQEVANLNNINKETILLRQNEIAKSAKRESDRIAADALICKILGICKPDTVQQVSIYSQLLAEQNNPSNTSNNGSSQVIDT